MWEDVSTTKLSIVIFNVSHVPGATTLDDLLNDLGPT